jgi:hypothetical protein
VEDPHDQQGPERRCDEIGEAGETVEKSPGGHEVSFGDGQEGFPHKGAEDQGGNAENANQKTNLPLLGSGSQKVDRNGWNQNAEHGGENKLGKETEDEITA